MDQIAVLCHVDGRVQGVGFRYWAERTARQLGLKGWVKNLPGGSVEVLAQGPDDVVATFLEQLQSGPRFATVTTIRHQAIQFDPTLAGFEIRF